MSFGFGHVQIVSNPYSQRISDITVESYLQSTVMPVHQLPTVPDNNLFIDRYRVSAL